LAKTLYIVAGELSGDTHGEGLIESLLQMEPAMKVGGFGGPKMHSLVGTVDWLDRAAVMGLVEVLKNYTWFKRKLDLIVKQVIEQEPDLLVLIDYPKFNLMLAERVRDAGLRTKIVYYISPKVWAWNKGRVPKMAKILDKIVCIFPFEVEIYAKEGLTAEYVGNPLVDQLGPMGSDEGRNKHLVGLFPGSREREIVKLFPLMLATAIRLSHRHPELRFEVPAATPKLAEIMEKLLVDAHLPRTDRVKINMGGSHDLMRRAYCGIVASGTATLEAAWLGLPYCLVYKVAMPTYIAAKLLVKIQFIGLVNILAGKQVVEEFIQGRANPCNLEKALEVFLTDSKQRSELQKKLLDTAANLGESGVQKRAARAVLKALDEYNE
jgi:lipid-A-disaccharide synthase